MPTYEYRCPGCGIIERFHRIGTAPSTVDCLDCGTEAKRVISSPMLGSTAKPRMAAMAQAEQSRHEPELARRADAGRSTAPQPNPAMERLVGKQRARQLRTAPHPAARPANH